MSFKLRIRPPFFAVAMFFLLLVLMSEDPAGRDDVLLRSFVGALLLGLGTLVHELAQVMVAQSRGFAIDELVLHPLGAAAKIRWERERPVASALVAAAGPAANLACAGLVWLVAQPVKFGRTFVDVWVWWPLFLVNALLGVVQCIPAFPLDGSRVLRGLLAHRDGYVLATRKAVSVSRVLALAIALLGIVGPIVGWSCALTLVFPLFGLGLMAMGEAELQRVSADQASQRVFEMFRMFEMRRGGASPPPPEPEPSPSSPAQGPVIDVDGSSRVVDDTPPAEGPSLKA